MADLHAIRVSGSNLQEFSRALTAAFQALPPGERERLKEIDRRYFGRYGFEGTYARMNNRSVAQIFAEYEPVEVKPIASGEMDGVRYELYPPPPPDEEPIHP